MVLICYMTIIIMFDWSGMIILFFLMGQTTKKIDIIFLLKIEHVGFIDIIMVMLLKQHMFRLNYLLFLYGALKMLS